jgi:hypothetical protein
MTNKLLSGLVVGVALLPLAYAVPVGATEVSSGNGSTSWNQKVEVSVAAHEQTVNFVATGLNGDGTSSNHYITYNAANTVQLQAAGVGLVVITDQDGNVLYTFNKTDSALATLAADINLPSGVGLYELTAYIIDPTADPNDLADPSNTITVYDSKSIFMDYRATPITPFPPDTTDPGTPGVPSTGSYLYIGGYAIATSSILFYLAVITVLATAVVAMRRKIAKRVEK